MIIISHRGNISGPVPDMENHPDYIREALKLGYECEIDVWYQDDEWWLGHDEPVYDVGKSFLRKDKLWCHAKNLEALDGMLNDSIHCFWHQDDDYTLTSKGYIWTYPGKPVADNSIAVLPEHAPERDISTCFGVCTDNVSQYII
jgi:hypothetical protein